MGIFKKKDKPAPRPTTRIVCGEVGHPKCPSRWCVRTDPGHTMHRCGLGDCEWGHR